MRRGYMDYYFIVNPNSGNGAGLHIWNQIKALLKKNNISFDVFFTAKQLDAKTKAFEITNGRTEELKLFAVGGDGTINEVLNGMDMSANVIFGAIPSGSGNDFCRSLGYPRGLQDIYKKLIEEPYVRSMDYGVVNTADGSVKRRFLVSCGIGFDAAVCHTLCVSPVKAFFNRIGNGKIAYPIIGVQEFVREKLIPGSIVLDGDRRVDFKSIFFMSFHNHPYEGGGYKFAPNALWNDGMLDVTTVSTKNRLKLLPILLDKKSGLKENGYVRFFPCREVEVHTDRPLALHADGENLGLQTDFTVRIIHGQLRVMT